MGAGVREVFMKLGRRSRLGRLCAVVGGRQGPAISACGRAQTASVEVAQSGASGASHATQGTR